MHIHYVMYMVMYMVMYTRSVHGANVYAPYTLRNVYGANVHT